MNNGRRLAAALMGWLVLSVGLWACGMTLPGPTASPVKEPSDQPQCAPAAQPIATYDQTLLREAQAFRDRVGLETGQAWILAVYADPTSVTAFDQRLLPCEQASLEARPSDASALALAIDSHTARYPDEYGGSFLDRDGTLFVLFTGRVAEHELAIGRLVHPKARVLVRPARWAFAHLEELKDRIGFQHAWLAAEGAVFDSVGIDPVANQVVLRVLSADPSVVERIVFYYGAGSDLRVEVIPNDLALLPRGTLRGRAVDEQGRAVAGLDVKLLPDVPGAGPDSEIAIGTGPAGLFYFENIHAIGYEVQLLRFEGSVRVVVSSQHVVVPAGDMVFIEMVVTD